MKSLICAVAVAAAVVSATADAQEALARRNGCTNCHSAATTTRRMPAMSFPELAQKYAGVSDDELVARLKDGSTKHPPIRGTEAQTRDIIRWMRTLK
jgi:cytochrome c